jgi:hypothetical protein
MFPAWPRCHVQKVGVAMLCELPPEAQRDARITEVVAGPELLVTLLVPEALPNPPPRRAGVAVSVRAGPFAGMHGVVCDCDERRRRVIITVEVLHRPVSLEIDRLLLDVLPPPDPAHSKGLTMPPQKMTPPINPHRPPVPAASAQADRPADRDHAAATTVTGADDGRSELSKRVRAIIVHRATAAGLSDIAYFREIIAGRAPRITRQEAARDPTP